MNEKRSPELKVERVEYLEEFVRVGLIVGKHHSKDVDLFVVAQQVSRYLLRVILIIPLDVLSLLITNEEFRFLLKSFL